jgi:hypothetical protein
MILPLLAALASPPVQAVEAPFRVTDRAIIVDAKVNGKLASFMFDTGFSGAFILTDSIDLGKPTGTMTLQDFVGSFQAPTHKVISFEMGGQKIPTGDMVIVQMPNDGMTESYGTHVDGIMGFEAINQSVVEINFEKKKFIFHPKSMDIRTRQADNQRTFMTKMLPVGVNSIELLVKAENGGSLVLALDTGNSFYATTHKDVLERIGLWQEGRRPKFMKQSFVASGPVASWSYRMKGASIFGVPVAESTWDIIDLPSSSADKDGTVGFGFLKNFNIIIDTSRRRVWMENFTGRVADDPVGMPGFLAAWSAGQERMVVVQVTPGSPAAQAGVKVGDHLIGLDGQEMRRTEFRQLYDRLEGPVGSEVSASFSRNGELIRLSLPRAAMVNEPSESAG